MAQFPLPNPPNFRVTESVPGQVKLNWADFPASVKTGHNIVGFRVYRSAVKGERGARLADEKTLTPSTFTFTDTTPGAGATQHYLVVAVEDWGFGVLPFGQSGFGARNVSGLGDGPFNRMSMGSAQRGYGETQVGVGRFGI